MLTASFLLVTLVFSSFLTSAHPPQSSTQPPPSPESPLPSIITVVRTPPILYSNNNTSEYTFYSYYICPTLTFELDEFDRFPNGSVHIKTFKQTLERSAYILENNTVTVCKPNSNLGMSCITVLGYKIALISLIFQLIAFWISRDMERYLSFSISTLGILVLIMNLISLQYFLYSTSQDFKTHYTIPALNHLFVLGSISVISMMSTEIFMNTPDVIRSSLKTLDNMIMKVLMGLLALVIFLMIVIMTFMIFSYAILTVFHEFNIFTIFFQYEPDDFCWSVNRSPCLLFFVGQVIAFILMNFGIHYFSDWTHRTMRYDVDMVGKVASVRWTHMILLRFSAVVYTTYFIGALATIPALSGLWGVFHYLHIFEITFLLCWSGFIQVTGILYRMNII